MAGVARGWRSRAAPGCRPHSAALRHAARLALCQWRRAAKSRHAWPGDGAARRRRRALRLHPSTRAPLDALPCPRPPSQSPNSFFMDVRCSGCMTITTVFSHATNVRYRRRSGSSARPRHTFLPRSRGRLSLPLFLSSPPHTPQVVVCGSCAVMLCQPTGGKARLTEGCSFRKKLE